MSENNRVESDSESESDDDILVTIKRKDGSFDPPRISTMITTPSRRDDISVTIKRKDGTLDPPHPGIPINTTRPPDVSIEDWKLPYWERPGRQRKDPPRIPTMITFATPPRSAFLEAAFLEALGRNPPREPFAINWAAVRVGAPTAMGWKEEPPRSKIRRYNLRPRGIITNKNPLKKHRYVLRLSSKKSKLN